MEILMKNEVVRRKFWNCAIVEDLVSGKEESLREIQTSNYEGN